MAVTQKQIAERLNVSRSLVVRALKGHPEVADSSRRLVERAAKEMGYDVSANHAARSLIAQRYGSKVKTGVLAMVVTLSETLSPRHFPFFATFIEGAETEATSAGFDVCTILRRPRSISKLIRGGGIDGILLSGFFPEEVPRIQDMGLSVVTYQEESAAAHSVRPDDRLGIYLATRHLVELGHRHIAYLGIVPEGDNDLMDRRLQGYQDALTESGLPVRQEWIDMSLGQPNATRERYCTGCDKCAACMGWQKLTAKSGGRPPFTAIVCHNDTTAMGVIEHASAAGLAVPWDVSVTGFDDISRQYRFEPEITSVGTFHFDMGKAAMRLLMDEVESASVAGQEPRYEHRVFPVELAVRRSTAPPPMPIL